MIEGLVVLLLGIVILMLIRVTGLLIELRPLSSQTSEQKNEPPFVVVEPPVRDYVPDPWVTRAVKQSNDWRDPQDRADELAALREKMKLSRYHS